MKGERIVGGIACSGVLERLTAYLDDDLPADERARLEGHVRACDACTRFGGTFAATVKALRERLGAAEDPPADVSARLFDALDELK